MTTKKLYNIYIQVAEDISEQIKSHRKGVLYTAIKIIFEDEKEQAEQLCISFNIKENSELEEDINIILDIIDFVYVDKLFGIKGVNSQLIDLTVKITNQIERKQKMIKWIVAGACILVGAIVCISYSNKNSSRKLFLAKQLILQSVWLFPPQQFMV